MRRDFLKACAAAGLGLAVPFRPAAAREKPRDEPYGGPYYVVFNASGGWDTTYLMDPKGVNGINRLFKEGDILTKGAHKYAPIKKHAKGGMCNEDFYAEFGDELLTFNGLDYSVNNHSPGVRYMATGKLDSLAYPTFAALVAACRGPDCPLAFLTFGNYSATGNLVAMSRALPAFAKPSPTPTRWAERKVAVPRQVCPRPIGALPATSRVRAADPRFAAGAARTCCTPPRRTRRPCSG